MADVPNSFDSQPPPRPRWVKVAAIIAIVVVAVVVVMLVAGGEHGPARHNPGDSGGQTPSVQQSP